MCIDVHMYMLTTRLLLGIAVWWGVGCIDVHMYVLTTRLLRLLAWGLGWGGVGCIDVHMYMLTNTVSQRGWELGCIACFGARERPSARATYF